MDCHVSATQVSNLVTIIRATTNTTTITMLMIASHTSSVFMNESHGMTTATRKLHKMHSAMSALTASRRNRPIAFIACSRVITRMIMSNPMIMIANPQSAAMHWLVTGHFSEYAIGALAAPKWNGAVSVAGSPLILVPVLSKSVTSVVAPRM